MYLQSSIFENSTVNTPVLKHTRKYLSARRNDSNFPKFCIVCGVCVCKNDCHLPVCNQFYTLFVTFKMWYRIKHIREYLYAINHAHIDICIDKCGLRVINYNTLFTGRKISLSCFARTGNLHALKFFHEHYPQKCNYNWLLDYAADAGHFECVQWIYKTCINMRVTVWFSCSAITQAAANGHFEIVKWLYTSFENQSISKYNYISPSALTYAAEYGHVEIVEWLHTHAKLSYTNDLLNCAIKGGHVNAIKYLWDSGIKGAESSFYTAIVHRDLELLKYLHRLGMHVGEYAVETALNFNRFQIAQWLYVEGICTNFTSDCYISICKLGNEAQMQWALNLPCTNDDIIHSALKHAITVKNYTIANMILQKILNKNE